MRTDAEAPIGVFDSGVGGLTVLRTLIQRLPHEHTVYLGDTARVPYGTRSGEVVTRYALLSARHLASYGIKLLVVACNTVSAHSLHALADALPIPVVGVIEPGAQAAAARTRGGTIAVLGTPATVASGAYQAALQRLAPLASVVARACPLFVPLAEDGWTDGEVPRLVAEKYLLELRRIGVDTAVLGCTHYPLLARTIADVLGPRVAIVDSADATAEAVASLMASREMLRPPGAAPRHRTLCTDVPDRFRAVAERFLGRPVGMVELVDLQP
ncbi:MAG: glutamate racemase [Deltaproteobacteria bacterium]|nr:MAG: glutamate racemase [Deltaproteobacteria bacterium]